MMKNRNLLVLAISLLSLLPCFHAVAQMPQLPADKDVRIGQLPNGLTYYVRHNSEPQNRVNFYIAQKVGSVQEEESQRGLAHFLEHMCFNGTQHFPGNGIVRYCESIGVKFGYNLNAYTSTDETVYNIDDVPVSPENIDSCLYILHDWADGLLLETAEIDKERGVIHEEWRMRSSAMQRIFQRNLPTLYPGSRYGERLPIGLMSVIDNFKPQELRNYYEKWYRPDLQGIIVVGDIDADAMVEKIKTIFSPIQAQENPAPYEYYPVPDTPEAIYVVDKDKEQQMAVIQLMCKHSIIPFELRNTPVYLNIKMLLSLTTSVINARLGELSQKPDCPFTYAVCMDDNFLISKTCDAFTVIVLPKPGQDAAAVKAAYQEIERARRFGLTDTEVIRAREEFMSNIEAIYNNRNKQKNDFYVQQYVRHFLENEAIPSIEDEYNLYQQMSGYMNAEAVGALLPELITASDSNFVMLACYPEKEGVAIPTAEELKTAVCEARTAELEPYQDNVKNEPLVPELPKKGQIVSENDADFGYKVWQLENGARVYWKQTDFNDSEVLFNATSLGGKSKVADKDFVNLELVEDVMSGTGLGNFTVTELEKKLAGKKVSCRPTIGDGTEQLSGSSTPKDLRTLFELIYLRFQEPANDTDGYNTTISFLRTQLENVEKVPEMALQDSALSNLYNHHPRKNRLHAADLQKVDYQTIRRIYSERFNAGGDFDFVFTGAFDVDSLRAFTEQYIAPLKAQGNRETYQDLNIRYKKGNQENRFKREMETPKGNIIQFRTGSLPYNNKNTAIVTALSEILTQRYLKSIREEGSMAYSVGTHAQTNFLNEETYIFQTYCPVKPTLADSALLLMEQGIQDIAKKGVTDEELEKVRQFRLKDYADSQRKNSYWQHLITNKAAFGHDLQAGVEDIYKNLTSKDLQNFVKKVLLKQNNCLTITMLPASLEEK